ncbi:MAG: DinB family protein [Kibdelosporangium sp.]
MSWTAPEITRPEPPLTGDERAMLLGYLEWQRSTLLWKCAGLTGEQLALRNSPPSILSLQGLLRHMTDVEHSWFVRFISAEPPRYAYRAEEDLDFDGADAAEAEADYERLLTAWEVSRTVLAGRQLDDTFREGSRGPMSLRWALLHMIEEYARHNGHADLIRERIDGVTGE